MAALAMKATKRNSVFSTMSAHSLCSDDEQAGSYAAVDKVPHFAEDFLTMIVHGESCAATCSPVVGFTRQTVSLHLVTESAC